MNLILRCKVKGFDSTHEGRKGLRCYGGYLYEVERRTVYNFILMTSALFEIKKRYL